MPRKDPDKTSRKTERWFRILEALPMTGPGLTIRDLRERIKLSPSTIDGHSNRTLQRDLAEMSAAFQGCIVGEPDEGSLALLWRRTEASNAFLTSFSGDQATVVALAHQYMAPILPGEMRDALEQLNQVATGVLDRQRRNGVTTWNKRVVIRPAGPDRARPSLHEGVWDAIQEALLTGYQLRVTYQNLKGDVKTEDSSPQGIIFENPIFRLAVKRRDRPTSLLAMQRILRAEVLNTRSHTARDFSLDALLRELNGTQADTVKLVLRVRGATAKRLEELPLAADQQIAPDVDDAGFRKLSATVIDDRPLQSFLLSAGDEVEVLKPVRLRRNIEKTVRSMSAIYAHKGTVNG